jgi:hypothetical protein
VDGLCLILRLVGGGLIGIFFLVSLK